MNKNLIKKVAYVGFDFGNSSCKVMSDLIKSPVIFDSSITKRKSFMGETHTLKFENEGVNYYVGKSTYGKPDSQPRKLDKQHLIHFLYTALALVGSEDNFLVMGLPVSQFQNDASELKNLIIQNNSKKVIFNGVPKEIKILDVAIFPEGVMAVDDEYNGIVIDIGGGTVDCCETYCDEQGKHFNLPYSAPFGMNTLYEEVASMINISNPLCNFNYKDAPKLLSEKMYTVRDQVFSVESDEIYSDFVEQILQPLRGLKYHLNTLPITLVGGGATVLEKYFKDAIGDNVSALESSIFSNSIAYQELCEAIFEV